MAKWEISNVAFCATVTYLLFLFSMVTSAEKKSGAPAAIENLDEQRRPARQFGRPSLPIWPTWPPSITWPFEPGRPVKLPPGGTKWPWLPTLPTYPGVVKLPPGTKWPWLPTLPTYPVVKLPVGVRPTWPWLPTLPTYPVDIIPDRPRPGGNNWFVKLPYPLNPPTVGPKLPPGIGIGGITGGLTVDEACDLLCPDEDNDYGLWRAPAPTKGRFVPIRG